MSNQMVVMMLMKKKLHLDVVNKMRKIMTQMRTYLILKMMILLTRMRTLEQVSVCQGLAR